MEALVSKQRILEGQLTIVGRLVDASNATLFGDIDEGLDQSFSVVYKPVAGERPLWDFPDGTLAAREVAAYELSSAADFNCVPTTVMREGPFGVGAVQQWIEIVDDVDVISLAQSHDPGIRQMALFDVVINNTDRKFGHILVTEDGKVFGCDHGVTFHEVNKLRTVLWQFAGLPLTEKEDLQLANLLAWLENDESQYFRSLLTINEIVALIKRIADLRGAGFPFPSDEWPAVPWPPV